MNEMGPGEVDIDDEEQALSFLESFLSGGSSALESAPPPPKRLSLEEMLEMQRESSPDPVEVVTVEPDHAIRQIEALVRNNAHLFQTFRPPEEA